MSNDLNEKPIDEMGNNNFNSSDSSTNNNINNSNESENNSVNNTQGGYSSVDYTLNNNRIDDIYGRNTSSENNNYSSGNYTASSYSINDQSTTYNNPNPANTNVNNSQNNFNTHTDSTINSSTGYTTTVKEKKKNSKGKKAFATIAAALVISLISGSIGGLIVANHYTNNSTESLTPNTSNYQSMSINVDSNPYYAVAVYEKNKNSVVGVSTTSVQKYQTFFGGIQEQEARSIGSGVIINSNGMILTNSHVIGDGNAKSVTVTLYDGSTEDAEVLWYDTSLDLAVIKINKSNLPCATLGDSDSLLVGEPVVAMGNPMSLDLSGTTTTGIISGLNRSITVENKVIEPLLQTSASINPGNSGGPLFNASGEVIGINTAKLSDAEGIGFSIPINTVTKIINQLTNTGKITTLYYGITGISVEDYQTRLGVTLSVDHGVYISEVVKDSPAKGAGLRAGDIIIGIDDTEIKTFDDLKRVLYNYQVDDKAQVKYIRDGEELSSEIVFKEKPNIN